MKVFDRFMVSVDIGHSLDLVDLTVPERWCFVAGLLAVAAKSPVRGCLLAGERAAHDKLIAKQADVSIAIVKSTRRKLREVGLVVDDAELGCERITSWDRWNPAPREDATAADRQRRRRERIAASRNDHAPVTDLSRRDTRNGHALVTGGEEEVKEEHPPNPPREGGVTAIPDSSILTPPRRLAGNSKRHMATYEDQVRSYASSLLPGAGDDGLHAVRAALGVLGAQATNERVLAHVAKWNPDLVAARHVA